MDKKNMRREAGKVFAGLAVITMMLAYPLAFAATFETQTPATSATVNSFVDTSISPASIAYGNLDPGTSYNAMTGGNVTITNTANSNTIVDVYLKGSNLTNGSNIIPAANQSIALTSGGAKTRLAEATWAADAGPNQGFKEDLAISGTQTIFFWLDVPAGQLAGDYTGTATLKSVASGGTP